MTDPFAQLIPEAKIFLRELAANNNRDWFTASKARYQAELKAPAMLLQEQLTADLAKTAGDRVSAKLFRPQRDIRFSKDKTPYHNHLHMFWQIQGRLEFGLFLGVSPDYCRIGGGVMGFDKTQLLDWRTAIDGAEGIEIAAQLDNLAHQGFIAEDPELKRVPSAFDKDHAQGDLLRRKSLTVWRNMPNSEWSGPLSALNAGFASLMPLRTCLSDCLTAGRSS
ncbi:TIGR02453 family protein [Rhodobacterales bacterium 56_14_T64]|nr:TIGR02453 family protein [Rhodobacterales bacterium 56_14_T64]